MAGTASRGVRAVTLDSADGPLSALLAEPSGGPPRAAVVALHGGGMRAGYFDSTAHPDLSLLTLGARLGYTVLALDRPGYGRSAERFPDGRSLDEQAVSVRSAIAAFAAERATGAGVLLLGHSYGGKLALSVVAAPAPDPVLAVDVSGCGRRPAADLNDSAGGTRGLRGRHLNWGPSRLYPPGAVGSSARIVTPMPPREVEGVADWERRSEELLPRIRVPVRLTFAEYEAWWRHTDEDLADLRERLAGAPRVVLDRLPGAGHNISLGLAARTYHLRALAFLEESLRMRELSGPSVGAAPGSAS
ncbi:alpha/beta hydrolase family protein [Streptomyces endophyticus]|uniref:Alpha/beta fold hydrolase n=1 Tax=Streptomyces endophyticus TaxID=714166 RepID=A0ABU6F2A0_9ACTN|nr:alpha/beta fold hydrolase [Streptomyces endophyticus]MEB8337515.1 alpha/beta fold hydrolase [Streptomyces endophyticus]